jgi:hypothetical protein
VSIDQPFEIVGVEILTLPSRVREQDVAREPGELSSEPSSQWHGESALRPVDDVGWQQSLAWLA